jgi:hypothetical protein
MKPLTLESELSWRTSADKLFLNSPEWKAIRLRILKRDNYTCAYCGFRNETGQQVNHVDGNPKNNGDKNLEVICPECHKYLHSGLWCAVKGTMKVFKRSKYPNNEIVRKSRELRIQGKTDTEIIAYLGLKQQVPWKQDLEYLRPLFGFQTSQTPIESEFDGISEEEQKSAIRNRENW